MPHAGRIHASAAMKILAHDRPIEVIPAYILSDNATKMFKRVLGR
jgi:hypothetical protein